MMWLSFFLLFLLREGRHHLGMASKLDFAFGSLSLCFAIQGYVLV